MALTGFFIFLGVPILAWGIGDAAAFFKHPARLIYSILLFVLTVYALLNISVPGGGERADRKAGIKRHRVDLYLIQVLSLSIVFLAPFTDGRSTGGVITGDAFRYSGLVFVVMGFVLMEWAKKHLGKQFSIEVTVQKDHSLVRNGPYALLRHPRYLGIILLFSGISFVFGSLISLAVVPVLSAVLIWRVAVEETLMKQEFGNEWEEYCCNTWRIFPFVF